MKDSVMISVIMPTYNTPATMLREAVESILKQSYSNFEFLIIDDASTNGSDAYLKSLTDKRIHIIWNSEHKGITKSLNDGLRIARGKYIARMDADDISSQTRFEKQLEYMENHPSVLLCGTKSAFMLENGNEWRVVDSNIKRRHDSQMDMDIYRITSLFYYPGPNHPTIMINRILMDKYNIMYDEYLTYAQDYDLYVRASKVGDICTLAETLHFSRIHSKQVSKEHKTEQAFFAKVTQRKLLEELLGNITDEELDFYYVYSRPEYSHTKVSPTVKEQYDRLIKANQIKKIYNGKKMKHFIYSNIMTRLACQSFTPEMSKTEKTKLLLKYLPIRQALKALIDILQIKMQSRANAEFQ